MSTITGNRRYKVIEKYHYLMYDNYSITLEACRKPGIIADMNVPKDLFDKLKPGISIVRVAVFIDKPKETKNE